MSDEPQAGKVDSEFSYEDFYDSLHPTVQTMLDRLLRERDEARAAFEAVQEVVRWAAVLNKAVVPIRWWRKRGDNDAYMSVKVVQAVSEKLRRDHPDLLKGAPWKENDDG